MDPGTALAAVSLAIQLAGTVQTINEFLRTIRDAPSELVTLIETMDLMQSNLNHIHDLLQQQFSNSSLAGSPVFILNALKVCERRVEVQRTWVEEIKQSLTTRHLMKRTWASLNIRTKKKQLSEMQGQLKEAMASLHLAVTDNQWHVQLQQAHMTTTIHQLLMTTNGSECRPVLIKEEGLSIAPKSEVEYTQQYKELAVNPANFNSALHIISKRRNTIWYRGAFGYVATQETWIRASKSGFGTVRKPVPAKKVLTMTSPFLRHAFELYFGASFASVPRALRVYQIIAYDAPIFRMCSSGDLEGVQNELANGTISPFVVDEWNGWTLLHLAVSNKQPEICSLLLRLGSDPDREDAIGRKALSLVGANFEGDHHRAIDITRTLSQVQDISSTDVSDFIFYYMLSNTVDCLKIVEFLLSLDSVQQELTLNEERESHYRVLCGALANYGSYFASEPFDWEARGPASRSDWESIIRRLIRIGVDVHGPVPRFYPVDYPCKLSPYGTPLEELFRYTKTADETKDAADAWLQILSTEGKDILTYLEKEKALHAISPMFITPGFGGSVLPRHLVFSLGEAPTVYVDWWIDSECSTSLVRQEFKNTNILRGGEILGWTEWQEYLDHEWKFLWPINYPRWSDSLRPYDRRVEDPATWKRLRQRAQERADRRWHKKAKKAARLNGTRTHHSMPGAWPE